MYIYIYTHTHTHTHTHTMEYCSGIKRNETGSFVVMKMNLKSIIQSEVSWKEEDDIKYRILMDIYGI